MTPWKSFGMSSKNGWSRASSGVMRSFGLRVSILEMMSFAFSDKKWHSGVEKLYLALHMSSISWSMLSLKKGGTPVSMLYSMPIDRIFE